MLPLGVSAAGPLSVSFPGVAGPEVPTVKRVGLQQGGAGGGAAPQVGWGEKGQRPRASVRRLSSSLSLPPGDRRGYAARRGAGAPFLHSASPQSPSQQLPRGQAEGQGSVLASPLGRAAAGTQWECAQPREVDRSGEEELHRSKGQWSAAGHAATSRVWLHRHRPEVRAQGLGKGLCMWEGSVSCQLQQLHVFS